MLYCIGQQIQKEGPVKLEGLGGPGEEVTKLSKPRQVTPVNAGTRLLVQDWKSALCSSRSCGGYLQAAALKWPSLS